jgi:general secretion pathway protein A
MKVHARAQKALLIIDEAQYLSPDVIDLLRLLTNLETEDCKLLRIILIGQPELQRMLARPELEQMSQRITARYHLVSCQ